MTEADYLAVTRRDARQFRFFRIRSGVETEFTPEDGAKLHFANRDTDTLEMTVPVGFLRKDDAVRVTYRNVTVFLGTLERRVAYRSRGLAASERVTVCGPWSKMARLVYRQNWFNGRTFERSSRLILNQTQSGAAQNVSSELREILSHAADACGYTVGTISAGSQTLPFDECRDITVADAVKRELRFFPKSIVSFNYATSKPTINISRPSGSADAAYVAEIPKTLREHTYTEHPITGVDLEIETTGEIEGVQYRNIAHQTAGDTTAGNPDCLYATLRLAGASGSTVRQSFDSKTEDIPADLNDKTWWQQKHPRIANVNSDYLIIKEAKRSGKDDADKYPRISAASAGDLEAAGLRCRTEKFTCKATILSQTDEEEEIELTMFFVTTNATTRKYTWVASSESTSGETVPDNLAKAILADRSGELLQERMTVRLGESLPTLGDMCDGLLLQAFDVDCGNLTAELSFGQPEHLSPEDMAALLSGFRNKRTSTASSSRSTGKKSDDGKEEVELGGIPPVSSSEFCPGTKKKTTIAAKDGETGAIVLDSAKVGSGEKIEVHKLTVNEAGKQNKEYKILSTEDIVIPVGKTIKSTYVNCSSEPGGMNTIVFNYTDGSSDTFNVMNGLNGQDGSSSDPGSSTSPSILFDTQNDTTYVYVDGELAATIPHGKKPEITANKVGKVTTILCDGKALATIADGADGGGQSSLTDKSVITGLTFSFSNGKLVANVSKSVVKVAEVVSSSTESVDVCEAKEVTVVTSESYDSATHKFTNTRRKVKVIGDEAAAGETPFTATPLGSE